MNNHDAKTLSLEDLLGITINSPFNSLQNDLTINSLTEAEMIWDEHSFSPITQIQDEGIFPSNAINNNDMPVEMDWTSLNISSSACNNNNNNDKTEHKNMLPMDNKCDILKTPQNLDNEILSKNHQKTSEQTLQANNPKSSAIKNKRKKCERLSKKKEDEAKKNIILKKVFFYNNYKRTENESTNAKTTKKCHLS